MKTRVADNSAMRTAATSPGPLAHDAFYKFVRVSDVDAVAATLRELTHELTGSILVAPEGINGMLAGAPQALDKFQVALRMDARLHGLFTGIAFKRSACTMPPFQRMKVHSRPEVLPLGVTVVDAVGHAGTRLGPQAWRELMAHDDVVVIDNRNSFEFRLGHFKRAVVRRCTTSETSRPGSKRSCRPGGRSASAWRCTAPAASAARRRRPGCTRWAWR